MKIAKLKSVYIDRSGDWCRSGNDTGEFYLREEVDELVSKLKEQISTERSAKVDYHISANDLSDGLTKAYAENKRLSRALWLARAKAYRYIAELITCFNPDYVRNRKMFTPNNQKQKQMNSLEWARLMLKVESKCRAKAEEYK